MFNIFHLLNNTLYLSLFLSTRLKTIWKNLHVKAQNGISWECEVDERIYALGERFQPSKRPDLYCQCREEFRGAYKNFNFFTINIRSFTIINTNTIDKKMLKSQWWTWKQIRFIFQVNTRNNSAILNLALEKWGMLTSFIRNVLLYSEDINRQFTAAVYFINVVSLMTDNEINFLSIKIY